jgi:hypothetical protein
MSSNCIDTSTLGLNIYMYRKGKIYKNPWHECLHSSVVPPQEGENTQSTIKSVQCDNEREFDNLSSQAFFLSHGMLLRMSCTYTSPLNGKTECIICSTNNVICSLLFQALIHACFWASALHCHIFA